MNTLFTAPPTYELPVSKGGDLFYAFRLKAAVLDDHGQPVLGIDGKKTYEETDFPEGASVAMVIETGTTTVSGESITAAATIEGSVATVWEDVAVADAVTTGKLWRVIVTTVLGRDAVLCNGKTVRYDGARANTPPGPVEYEIEIPAEFGTQHVLFAVTQGPRGPAGKVDMTTPDVPPPHMDDITGLDHALDCKEDTARKGVADGYAPLDANLLIPSVFLPSYVDDVIEVAKYNELPHPGESGKIYNPLDKNKVYRWGGSDYAEISSSPGSTDEVAEGAAHLYYTDARADARADGRIGAAGLAPANHTHPGRLILTVSGPVSLAADTDYVIFIAANGAVTLPSAVGNMRLYIMKNIHVAVRTVSAQPGQTIEGLGAVTLQKNQIEIFASDGAQWRTLNSP